MPPCKVISVGPQVAHGFNFAREHDKTLWRAAYVVKRIASEQGQVMPRGWLQDANVGGSNDLHRLNNVVKASLLCSEFDFVADTNVAKRTEKSVAVGGQSNVAVFTR